jgi:hypothetical protein
MAGRAIWTPKFSPEFASAQDIGGTLMIFVGVSGTVPIGSDHEGCASTNGYLLPDIVINSGALATTLTSIASAQPTELFVSGTVCSGRRPSVITISIYLGKLGLQSRS